jgi:hypothetical protein
VTPHSVYLTFNRDCLRGAFVPAKQGARPGEERGHWLIVQEQKLVVVPEGEGFRLPIGERPKAVDRTGNTFGSCPLAFPVQGCVSRDSLNRVGDRGRPRTTEAGVLARAERVRWSSS